MERKCNRKVMMAEKPIHSHNMGPNRKCENKVSTHEVKPFGLHSLYLELSAIL